MIRNYVILKKIYENGKKIKIAKFWSHINFSCFRYAIFENTKRSIEEAEGLERFTQGYKEFGVFVRPDGGVMCREWIPNAKTVYLSGEFSKFLISSKFLMILSLSISF